MREVREASQVDRMGRSAGGKGQVGPGVMAQVTAQGEPGLTSTLWALRPRHPLLARGPDEVSLTVYAGDQAPAAALGWGPQSAARAVEPPSQPPTSAPQHSSSSYSGQNQLAETWSRTPTRSAPWEL